MKTLLTLLTCCIYSLSLTAQQNENIALLEPDLKRGMNTMQALALRASATDYDTTALSLRDLSDLLWAANGINRKESGKRTAPSAINAQDIDIYVFMKQGVYLYNPQKNILEFLTMGDHRMLVAGRQEIVAKAPVICVLVSDISKFRMGEESQKKLIWGAEDAGIVSQNISIFCASVGLVTRPRSSMEQEKIRVLLNLKENQHLMLNNPVGYAKK
jgi:SagB-type dehydrogenase family enzyme